MQPAISTSGNPFAYGDRPQMGLDIELASDPASGAFFQSDGRKHDDLKIMLDSNKDGLKLEAMKRIIGMIARGRDASVLFPAVVKNVVSKNIEVKKLVYVYLVRYAEEQQDLALLSISTFQRALKDPNQLIRASALRVLSSIRVGMIVPIVMLAIRDSASDMSPYVRKTAAHAIPKLYSLDPDQKDELVTLIEKLLSDRTTLVVGSAVMAFDEVCPERVDLIHKNYRKLCNLLVDVDEWGQVIIINMLTRYSRTQFVDPNADDAAAGNDDDRGSRINNNQKFYDDSTATDSSSTSSNESSNDDDEETSNKKKSNLSNSKKNQPIASPSSTKTKTKTTHSSSYHVDLDHRLLLRQTKPLLQSRNASVVMAVAQLYHHIAPRNEVQLIAKALIRLLRSHKEVQSVVLTCIASMSTKRKSIFEPFIKSFYVLTSDPTHIKLLKLDILTNLASASSISLILREFQTYISSSDRPFVAATIQAIGRCAASIEEVTETCLNGLVHLLSNRDEYVVAESVVVIKKLLQTKAAEHFDIISQMAKLLDFITVSAARASIIWLIGEYNEKVPKIAPDVLRKMAKSFVDEEDAVKLQILNLAVKLYLTNPQQTTLLCQYVFTLARYDPNYDIRDRARCLRQFIFPSNGETTTILSENAKRIFLSQKPAPALESKHRERDSFQLGSLSHYLNMRTTGYKDLPPFPNEAPDSSVRNIEGFMQESSSATATALASASGSSASNQRQHDRTTPMRHKKNQGAAASSNDTNFYAESSTKSSEYSNSQSGTSNTSNSDSGSDDSSDTETASSSSSSSKNKNKVKKRIHRAEKKPKATAEGSSIKSAVNRRSTNPPNNDIEVDNGTGTSDSESSSYVSNESESDTSSATETETSQNTSKEPQLNAEKHRQNAEQKPPPPHANEMPEKTDSKKSNLDLLLDLDDILPIGPVMTPSLGGFLTPGTPMSGASAGGVIGLMPQHVANRIELVGPSFIEFKHKELLNKLSGNGLQVSYRYTRSPHLYSAAMVSVELQFVNQTADDISSIQMGHHQSLPAGMNLNEFAPISNLLPQQMATSVLGVDFNDSTQAIEFEITHSGGKSRVTLKPPVGELIRSVHITEAFFKEQRTKLRGMNEHQSHLDISNDETNQRASAATAAALKQRIFECINVAALPPCTGGGGVNDDNKDNIWYFVGQTLSSKSLVLITLDWTKESSITLAVNCEKMVIGSMVLNELRNHLSQALKC